MSNNNYDFIIVGAGITGLELGALLSHDGHRVLVIEKNKTIGGRARLWNKDGFMVDYGIHLIRFGPESAITKICRHLGHEVNYIPLGPSFVLDKDERKKLFPTSPAGFLRSGMFTFLDRLLGIALIIKIRMGKYNDWKEVSVRDWMELHGIQSGLARYFILVSASMMVCPFIERSSVGEMLTNVSKVLTTGYSVMYPRDGWKPLFDLFENRIKEKGEIRTGARVDSILVEDRRAVGVKCGGETIRSGSVIVTVPVQQIFDGLLDRNLFSKELVGKCNSLKPTACIVLDYGLKKKICDDSGLWYLWNPMSFGMFTSNIEPCVAPPGKQLLTWIYPINLKEMEQAAIAKKREAELEEALGCIFPDLERNIQWRRAMRMRMVDGVEVNINQFTEARVGPLLPGVENLYLSGDSSCAPGAGGDIAHESVVECYRVITGRSL